MSVPRATWTMLALAGLLSTSFTVNAAPQGSDPTEETREATLPTAIGQLKESASAHPVSGQWMQLLDAMEVDLDALEVGDLTDAESGEALNRLQISLARLRTTLRLPGIGPIADDVAVVTNRLEQRVAILAAARPILRSSDDPQAMQEDVRQLLEHLEQFEAGRSGQIARKVSELASRLRESSNDRAAELAAAVNNYFNHYNVRAIVSERFLDRIARDTRVESGPVQDFILGADVYGNQTTRAQVGARLHPNSEAASILLEVTGTTMANTQAYPRDQGGDVSISSQSESLFNARRRVDLTADGLNAGEPVVSVSTRNRILGAETSLSGIPLLSLFGEALATSAAEARRGEAEAIGVSRVRERVLPQFRSETDQRIQELNETYQTRVLDRLSERKAFPEVFRFSSTATHLFMLGRIARFDELGGHEPLQWLPADSLISFQIHESAINNAIAHGGIKNRKIDENSIGRLTGETDPAMDEPDAEPAEEAVITMELAQEDPARVRFENNELQLVFHATALLRQDGKLPNQRVRVRYAFEKLPTTLRVVRKGTIDLSPMAGDAAERRTEEEIAKFRDSLELIFLPEFEIGSAPKLNDRGGQPVSLNLSELKLRNGWLSVSFH